MPDPEVDRRTRRGVMALTLGLGAAIAGCLGDAETQGDDSDTGEPDESDDDDPSDEEDSPLEDNGDPENDSRPEVLADNELDVDHLHSTVLETIEATAFRGVFAGEAIEDGEVVEVHTVAVTAIPSDRRGKRAWDVEPPADTEVDWATADSAEYVDDDELYLNSGGDEPTKDNRITAPWENFVENGIGADVNALFELIGAAVFDPPEHDEDENTYRVEATTFDDPDDVGATLDTGAIILNEAGLPVRMDAVVEPHDDDATIEASIRVKREDVTLERPEWVDEIEENTDDDPDRTPEEIAIDWASEADNVENTGEIVDSSDQASVIIENGVEGEFGNYVFEPPIVRIDAGTDVTWEWVTSGHNVAEIGGQGATITGWDDEHDFFGEGHTHTVTFEEPGVALYECLAHRSHYQRGAIIVE